MRVMNSIGQGNQLRQGCPFRPPYMNVWGCDTVLHLVYWRPCDPQLGSSVFVLGPLGSLGALILTPPLVYLYVRGEKLRGMYPVKSGCNLGVWNKVVMVDGVCNSWDDHLRTIDPRYGLDNLEESERFEWCSRKGG